MKKISSFILLYFLFLLSTVHATSTEKFSIVTNPPFPNKNEKATAVVSGINAQEDAKIASVEWFVDEKSISKKRQLEFIPEKQTYVRATVTLKDKSVLNITKQVLLYNEDVFIEPISAIVPPWFTGKPSIIEEAIVRVVVFNPTAKDTVYQYTYNNKRLTIQSGNSSILLFSLNPFDQNHSLEIANRSGKISRIQIPTIQRNKINFYEINPLFSTISLHALPQKTQFKNTEINIKAIPLFFPEHSQIIMNWYMNKEKIQLNSSAFDQITLQKFSSTRGTSRLEFEAYVPKNIRQEAKNSIELVYE